MYDRKYILNGSTLQETRARLYLHCKLYCKWSTGDLYNGEWLLFYIVEFEIYFAIVCSDRAIAIATRALGHCT